VKQAASEIVADSVLASSSWIWRALGTPTRAQTACDRFATERASSRDRISAL